MQITLTQKNPRLWVMHLVGKLDGSNDRDILAEAQTLHEQGCRDLILDLSHLTYISSAGISALHRIAILFRTHHSDSENGETWLSSRAVAHELHSNIQQHVKFFSSTESVRHSLEIVGFNTLFETFTDMDQAVASFQ